MKLAMFSPLVRASAGFVYPVQCLHLDSETLLLISQTVFCTNGFPTAVLPVNPVYTIFESRKNVGGSRVRTDFNVLETQITNIWTASEQKVVPA